MSSEQQEIRPHQQDQQHPNSFANISPVKPGEIRTVTDAINPDNRNCIIAVPRYHENLFEKLTKYKSWLEEGTLGDPKIGRHYNRKVRTPEDLEILKQLIKDLRDAHSELFLDFTFHRKPKSLPMREYMNEFLRVKGIFNYYTFISWYRVTVYNESGDPDCQNIQSIIDKEGNEKREYVRKEYFIIPLFIRLKKNKVYDQFKSIHYINDSGTEYEVKPVNPKHFLRDDDSYSKDKTEKSKTKYENNFVPTKLED